MMFFTWGSSPLTRGKLGTPTVGVVKIGLIPAHAGKTKPANVLGRNASAHPRSRGENPISRAASAAEDGSSPLTRGKLVATSTGTAPSGLIPAHAGKTPSVQAERRRSRAHPRSRGENMIFFREERGAAGSSPLTRGKLSKKDCTPGISGLIPAHAGKTCGCTPPPP